MEAIRVHRGNIGCNVKDLYNISHYENPLMVLKDASPLVLGGKYIEDINTPGKDSYRCSVVMFSDRVDMRTIAPEFADLIENMGLGTVLRSGAIHNKNYEHDSAHKNEVYMWIVNRTNLEKWYADNRSVR